MTQLFQLGKSGTEYADGSRLKERNDRTRAESHDADRRPHTAYRCHCWNPARGASNDDGTDHRDANSYGRIDHVALHVADLDASAAFYSGVFRLQEIPAAAKGRRWFSLGKDVALHLLGERSAPVADDRSVHIALTSDNLEPILQRLRDRRTPWSDFAGHPGAVSTDGVRQIFLRDPDGYWVEVNDALKNTGK